jgi:4-amino-4-deoxychorismate lyase
VTVREVPAPAAPDVITAAEPHVAYPHKTTERDCFADAAREADIAEADDALLLTHEGWVAEGTVWSLCWWEWEGLRTPPLDLGILPGIGRARVLELVPGEEVRAQRAQLDGKSLFLVNAVRGVVPIESLDGARVPVDPRTAEVARRFWLAE